MSDTFSRDLPDAFDEEDEETTTRQLPDLFEREPTDPAVPGTTIGAEEGAKVLAAVTARDVARLMGEVTALYRRVEGELASSPHRAAEALGWLNEARTILLARPEHFPLAELRVQQARVLLRRVANSERDLRADLAGLVQWNLAWLILLALLFGLDGALVGRFPGPPWRPADAPASLTWFFPPWPAVLAGGIGGALAALILLGTQQSRRSYDAGSQLDYRLNPLKGAVWGGVMFYLVLAGFVTTAAITALDDATLSLADQARAAMSPLMIIVAFLAGLAQPRMLLLLRRIWGEVTGEGKDDNPTPAPTPTPAEEVPVATDPAPAGGASGDAEGLPAGDEGGAGS